MIYFIQQGNDGPIKIGHTTNVIRRLKSLQIGNPNWLQVLATAHGGHPLESELHARFQHLRLIGEWFEPAPELITYIRNIKSAFGRPQRVLGDGDHEECRMCGLTYVAKVAADKRIHEARHDALRDVSLPFPFVELLKDWGRYIATHGKIGSHQINGKYDKELGRRLCAFACWVDSNARLENPDDFERFMADRLDEFDEDKDQ